MWCGAFSILTILHWCSFEAIQDMDACSSFAAEPDTAGEENN